MSSITFVKLAILGLFCDHKYNKVISHIPPDLLFSICHLNFCSSLFRMFLLLYASMQKEVKSSNPSIVQYEK